MNFDVTRVSLDGTRRRRWTFTPACDFGKPLLRLTAFAFETREPGKRRWGHKRGDSWTFLDERHGLPRPASIPPDVAAEAIAILRRMPVPICIGRIELEIEGGEL